MRQKIQTGFGYKKGVKFMTRVVFFFMATLALLILVGCGDDSDSVEVANYQVEISFSPTIQYQNVTRVVVLVSGTGMDDISQDLEIQGQLATGILLIPVGEQRNITVNAYEDDVLVGTDTEVVDILDSSDEEPLIIYLEMSEQVDPVDQVEFSTEGMVLIPAGEFSMGDHQGSGGNNERPVHNVYLDAYYIDVYEVTNAQYARFLSSYGKNFDPAEHELIDIDSKYCYIQKSGSLYEARPGYEDYPVQEVSWYGAAAYAQFYGKRVPTEAEWEKAARGGLVGKKYPLGDEMTHNDANYNGVRDADVWKEASPVGSFAPNGYGLYDMSGNAMEWCADDYEDDYYSQSPYNNPKGPDNVVIFQNDDFAHSQSTKRAVRGGSWGTSSVVPLRVSERTYINPTARRDYLGFRCAQYATP